MFGKILYLNAILAIIEGKTGLWPNNGHFGHFEGKSGQKCQYGQIEWPRNAKIDPFLTLRKANKNVVNRKVVRFLTTFLVNFSHFLVKTGLKVPCVAQRMDRN